MKKSNYFKVIGAVAVSTVVSLAYAGFTEINSSGDIVSKDSANALRTSFSTPNQNIPAPLRTYSLWDKISETTKYNGTVEPAYSCINIPPIPVRTIPAIPIPTAPIYLV